MTPTYGNVKAKKLVGLLKRIERGDDFEAICQEVGRLGEDLASEDVAAAERSLLDGGYPSGLVSQLSAAFVLMRLYAQRGDDSKGRLPDHHILRRVTVEHDVFRCWVADLNDIADSISSLPYLSDVSCEFRRVAHISGHLRAMKEHMEQEEDIIFPHLRKHRWAGLCRAAQTDHGRIKAHIDNLATLVTVFNTMKPEDFKARLAACVGALRPTLRAHLDFEDRLLWPIALMVVDDPSVWQRIKALCDEIGYCGIHA